MHGQGEAELNSGTGLLSVMQSDSIRTLSSAVHLGCDASQWMQVVMCKHYTRKLLAGWLRETNSDVKFSQIPCSRSVPIASCTCTSAPTTVQVNSAQDYCMPSSVSATPCSSKNV